MPTVSIIVPCYNAAPWLATTLESCLAQSWPQREIIVVDDGSRDASLAIARSFAPHGVQVISQPNRGAAAARNTGLHASRGDFIQFLDADDALHPDKLRRQLARAATEPPDAVFTGRWGRFAQSVSETAFDDGNPLFADLAPLDFLLRFSSHDCMMHPAAWLVPRAVADSAGPWDERLSLNDDGEYFTRIAARAERIAYCAEAVSYYRSNVTGSLSGQRSRRHLESGLLAVDLITRQILALGRDRAPARRAAADLYQRFAYDYYPAGADLVATALGRARSLGGSTLTPLGGRHFQLLRQLVGWKLARRLQILAGRFPS